jgi:hypothetical protein
MSLICAVGKPPPEHSSTPTDSTQGSSLSTFMSQKFLSEAGFDAHPICFLKSLVVI